MTDPCFHVEDDGSRARLRDAVFHRPRTEAELDAAVLDRDPRRAEVVFPWDWELEPFMSVEALRTYWGVPDYTPGEKELLRMDMYKYMGAKKRTFASLFRKDTFKSDEEYQAKLESLSALQLLDKNPSYPPTFILHGTADSAVPVEQSYRFEKKLLEKGVPVGAAYAEGGEHSFENVIESPGDPGWDEYIAPCMAFVDKHIKA